MDGKMLLNLLECLLNCPLVNIMINPDLLAFLSKIFKVKKPFIYLKYNNEKSLFNFRRVLNIRNGIMTNESQFLLCFVLPFFLGHAALCHKGYFHSYQ